MAVSGDAGRLSSFRCSSGTWYEDVVERHINGDLIGDIERGDIEALLFETSSTDLLGIAAYSFGCWIERGSNREPATYLEVLAIDLNVQGCECPNGSRLVEYMLREVGVRARARSQPQLFYSYIAAENQRSLAVYRRYARPILDSQAAADSRYVLAVGILP